MLYYILYYIILYDIILYYVVLNIILYYIMLCYIMLYYILYYVVLYYIILYYIILYYITTKSNKTNDVLYFVKISLHFIINYQGITKSRSKDLGDALAGAWHCEFTRAEISSENLPSF